MARIASAHIVVEVPVDLDTGLVVGPPRLSADEFMPDSEFYSGDSGWLDYNAAPDAYDAACERLDALLTKGDGA